MLKNMLRKTWWAERSKHAKVNAQKKAAEVTAQKHAKLNAKKWTPEVTAKNMQNQILRKTLLR
jgi:hypothetical protein